MSSFPFEPRLNVAGCCERVHAAAAAPGGGGHLGERGGERHPSGLQTQQDQPGVAPHTLGRRQGNNTQNKETLNLT